MATAFDPNAILAEAQSAQLTASKWAGLTPQDRALVQQAIQANNQRYMRMTIPKFALCEPAGGGQSANYKTSNTLTYHIPQSASGWATDLIIDADLTVNYTAAGSGPTIAVNPGAPFNAFKSLTLQFGSNTAQIDLRPYFARVKKMMSGYVRSASGQTNGQAVSAISSLLYTGTPSVAGNNTWKFRVMIPLNALHPLTMEGVIPAMGNTSKGVVSIVTATDFNGVDPLDNPLTTNGTVALSGTVEVKMGFRDGRSLATLGQMAPVVLGPAGIGTVQYVQLEAKQNLVSGTMQRQHISTTLPIYQLVNAVIDGEQSSAFSTIGNVTAMEVNLDANAGNALYVYDNSGYVTMTDYYERIRDMYGQDFDQGIFVPVDAPSWNVVNPSNQEGMEFLNMTSNGYTAAHIGYKMTSVGSVSGINPRIESWALVVNPQGLKVR